MKDLILCITYISPEGSPIYSNQSDNTGVFLLDETLLNLKHEYPDCYLYIAGDFNARTRDFRDYIPTDNLHVLYHEVIYYESATFDLPRRRILLDIITLEELWLICAVHTIYIF